ncbi:four helix bundle protein [Candidatus Shapirobacteria bacterium CG09_land_8_20_14_0_10_39_12]|uniref:Four helix bundle protein n=1 Tax=Candidatus Shapirobacteria bacterium CG09_land_8_20_14_0_10_39_12 TaxID=1974885 RepID=A0A2H0WQC1_9BACT|nr:MAG: four helix bundle protein [Candidatus Shapirobacteria bacterium CG09_land_8_20_14_0_10_39_12]
MDNEEFKKKLIKRAFDLARKVIALVAKFPNTRTAWIITDQLVRAATSIGANIIEAQAASSKKDFVNFLNHSLKSGNETKFWLALARDLDEKLVPEINEIIEETDELVKILGSSILTLKGKNKL